MRDANRLQEIKRRIEWPLMIAAMTSVLVLGTAGCADEALTGPNTLRVADVAVAEQQQDAGSAANERQRDKNARSNGSAAQE